MTRWTMVMAAMSLMLSPICTHFENDRQSEALLCLLRALAGLNELR
jgi:hypothetical protein